MFIARSSSARADKVVSTAMAILVKRGCSSTPQGGVRYCDEAERSVVSLPSARSATASSSAARTSPTLPPRPSSASAMCCRPDGLRHAQRLYGFGHVMHAHDVGAVEHREHVAGDRA